MFFESAVSTSGIAKRVKEAFFMGSALCCKAGSVWMGLMRAFNASPRAVNGSDAGALYEQALKCRASPEERCSRSSQRCMTRQARAGSCLAQAAPHHNGAHLFPLILVFTQVS